MRERKIIVRAKDKQGLVEIMFEANQSMERQLNTIKKDVESFTDFITDLKKGRNAPGPGLEDDTF
jgi:hypothetical protein